MCILGGWSFQHVQGSWICFPCYILFWQFLFMWFDTDGRWEIIFEVLVNLEMLIVNDLLCLLVSFTIPFSSLLISSRICPNRDTQHEVLKTSNNISYCMELENRLGSQIGSDPISVFPFMQVLLVAKFDMWRKAPRTLVNSGNNN